MDLQSFHRESIEDREGFWAEQANLIHWHKPFERVLDYSNPPFTRWFVGGETNLCYNAIDRHLASQADKPALIYVSTETDTEVTYSFNELSLEVQRMAAILQELGVGKGECGSGVIEFVDPTTGERMLKGRYLAQSQGREALTDGDGALYLMRDPRGLSVEEALPEVFQNLVRYGDLCRAKLREEMQIEFAIENGRLAILDAVRVQRSSRAAVRIAVALAEDGIKTLEDFATCADWELAGGWTTANGERVKDDGLLEKFEVDLTEAQNLVMTARVMLGWVDPTEGVVEDDEDDEDEGDAEE